MTQTKLFTELTSEQSATVEGGLTLYIVGIRALRAGADIVGADDTYVEVNDNKIWGVERMNTGDYGAIHEVVDIGDLGVVSLWDRDIIGADDSLGSFQVNSPTPVGKIDSRIVSGKNSKYLVEYAVF